MPANYPSWNDSTPDTHPKAKPTRWRYVKGVLAICVENATYRRSLPFNGILELVSEQPEKVNGEDRYEVYCAWFGVKPPRKYPRISVGEGKFKIIPNYSGEVIDNLSTQDLNLNEILVRGESLPEEIEKTDNLTEGAVRTISINAYERNPIARRQCINHYGTSCYVCGFNFGAIYGKAAEGYIHVHHLNQLSEIGSEYVVDPVIDLRPVCPNCHAAIHCRIPAYTIEEVQEFILEQKNA